METQELFSRLRKVLYIYLNTLHLARCPRKSKALQIFKFTNKTHFLEKPQDDAEDSEFGQLLILQETESLFELQKVHKALSCKRSFQLNTTQICWTRLCIISLLIIKFSQEKRGCLVGGRGREGVHTRTHTFFETGFSYFHF